jgi:glutamate transport system substrate-binding protein
MRAVRWPVAVLVATLALAAGCSSGKSTGTEVGAKPSTFEAGTTMAALNAAQKVTIGTKFDQPLFGLKGLSGQPEGFDVEVAKIIVGGLSIPESKIAWVETPSAVREEKIAQGAVDLVVATTPSTPPARSACRLPAPTTSPARISWSRRTTPRSPAPNH